MIYFATPSSPTARQHMRDHKLGWIDTPAQGNTRPPNTIWCADNGCYTNNFDEPRWWTWLQRHQPTAHQCVFAAAPDVVGDAEATLTRATPWLPRIRGLGYPAGYVAQDGATPHNLPWNQFDVLFIGGTDQFKFSPAAITIVREARARSTWVHYGRINSQRRWRLARAVGAQSADGTFLKYAPGANMIRLMRWFDDANQSALFTLSDQP
jgi:hypothetical protein